MTIKPLHVLIAVLIVVVAGAVVGLIITRLPLWQGRLAASRLIQVNHNQHAGPLSCTDCAFGLTRSASPESVVEMLRQAGFALTAADPLDRPNAIWWFRAQTTSNSYTTIEFVLVYFESGVPVKIEWSAGNSSISNPYRLINLQ